MKFIFTAIMLTCLSLSSFAGQAKEQRLPAARDVFECLVSNFWSVYYVQVDEPSQAIPEAKRNCEINGGLYCYSVKDYKAQCQKFVSSGSTFTCKLENRYDKSKKYDIQACGSRLEAQARVLAKCYAAQISNAAGNCPLPNVVCTLE